MTRFGLIAFAIVGICLGCSSGDSTTTAPGKEAPPATTSSATGSTTSGTPAVVTYADVQAIFTKNCVGCHGATNPKEDVSLVSHESLMKGGEHGPTVVPGDPEGSLLIQVLRGSNGKKQMPMGMAPLPEEDIKKVEAWIKDGAKG